MITPTAAHSNPARRSRNCGAILTRSSLIAVTFCCAMLAGVQPLFSQERIELPDLGASADTLYTDREERGYALQLIFQLRELDLLIEDPQIDAYFNDMGYRLVAQTDEPGGDYTFLVINEPSLNAFATPGGLVVLHTGLIEVADESSEVAGVVAHEIAHVTQQHLERSFEAARQLTIPLALAALGLVLVGGAGAIAPALIGSQGLAAQAQINFTRSNEYEADRIGIQTLYNAGYDPEGMASMFAKFGRAARNYAIEIPEYLRTHPLSTTRIAEAKNRAAQLTDHDYVEDIDFHLIQARVRGLYTERAEQAVRFFTEELKLQGLQFPNAYRYGLTIALQRSGDLDQAHDLAQQLLQDDPDRLAYQIEMAHVEIAMGKAQQGLDRFAGLYRKFTGNRVLARYYAEALLEPEEPELARQALTILRDELVRSRSNPKLHELVSRAANMANDDVRALSANAESLYWRGQIHDAIRQLQRLSEREDLDYYQRAKVTARLSEMRLEFEQLVRLGYIQADPARRG